MARILRHCSDVVLHQASERLVILVITGALLLSACQPTETTSQIPRPVFAMQLADAEGLAKRSFPGRARAANQVNRSFRVSGPLITFPVNVGDQVKQGDILARIDPQDFENTLRTLEGQLQREQASLVRAEADYKRILDVFKADPGATSEAAVDRLRQVRDSSVAEVSSLEASVKNAQDQLSYTTLNAPFDGVVVETYVENFETVVARQPVLRLLDPSRIEFVINVPENLISLAPHVEQVSIVFDAFPDQEIPATVSEIGKEASQATRTYPVTLLMAQPDGLEILPGMAGQASVVSRPPQQTALVGIDVPATAVFTREDLQQSYVWVIDRDSNTIRQREVQLGRLSAFGVLIQAGLQSGEWIVTKGVNSLSEGQQVQILMPEQSGNSL